MSTTMSRPSRLLLYIGAITALILFFRWSMVVVPPPPPGSLGSPGKPPKSVAPGISLRILPLGDSITFGDGGSDGNAYRLELRKALVLGGSTVDMIGSQTSGERNEDNQHEGWGGARISQLLDKVLAQGTLRQHPNVILLHVGTNDLKDSDLPIPEPFEGAAHRLGVLIDAILCECPETVLIVAKITGQRPLFAQLRVEKYNAEIEGVVKEREANGFKVRMADHSKVAALELADDVHPNDAGYLKMAQNWLAGMQNCPVEWYKEPAELPLELPPPVCQHDSAYWRSLMEPPKMR